MFYTNFAIHVCSYTKESKNNIIKMLNKNVLKLVDGKLKHYISDMLSF